MTYKRWSFPKTRVSVLESPGCSNHDSKLEEKLRKVWERPGKALLTPLWLADADAARRRHAQLNAICSRQECDKTPGVASRRRDNEQLQPPPGVPPPPPKAAKCLRNWLHTKPGRREWKSERRFVFICILSARACARACEAEGRCVLTGWKRAQLYLKRINEDLRVYFNTSAVKLARLFKAVWRVRLQAADGFKPPTSGPATASARLRLLLKVTHSIGEDFGI